MKIEAGKFYRTRGGAKARIYATDAGGDFPVHGAKYHDGVWVFNNWRINGDSSMVTVQSASDLIVEWKDLPKFDVTCLPIWAHWIVMFRSGAWYWNDRRPVITKDGTTWCNFNTSGDIPAPHSPTGFDGAWTDSLFFVNRQNNLLELPTK